ncbi:MAG: hypothetical protein ABI895_31130 [Deltaproteobacteria bacterium]
MRARDRANDLLLNRLQFGFYSVLARLDVRADCAGVEGSFLEHAELYTRAVLSGHSSRSGVV